MIGRLPLAYARGSCPVNTEHRRLAPPAPCVFAQLRVMSASLPDSVTVIASLNVIAWIGIYGQRGARESQTRRGPHDGEPVVRPHARRLDGAGSPDQRPDGQGEQS